jgi:uncharacterized repeat protein (TIGR03803 family)
MVRIVAFLLIAAGPLSAYAGKFKVVHEFAGQALDGNGPNSLALGGGALYGTTEAGGSTQCQIVNVVGCGIVFSVDIATGAEQTVLAFDPRGEFPSQVTIAQKNLLVPAVFGDTLIAVPAKAPKERIVASLGGDNGNFPAGPVFFDQGVAVVAAGSGGTAGTCPNNATGGCGTLTSVDLKKKTVIAVYDFATTANGENPNGLISGGGTLAYGTTFWGGASSVGCSAGGNLGCGLIFAFDTATQKETILYEFKGGADVGNPRSVLLVNNILYGLTGASVFSLDPSSGSFKTVYNFATKPGGYGPTSLTSDGKLLYGTAQAGGANDNGTIWSVDPASGVETVLYDFQTPSVDGSMPSALVYAGGALYGTMQLDGPSIYGLVYKFTP